MVGDVIVTTTLALNEKARGDEYAMNWALLLTGVILCRPPWEKLRAPKSIQQYSDEKGPHASNGL